MLSLFIACCSPPLLRRTLVRLLAEDDGQDIVEYAFLAAFIGIAGWAAVMAIDEAVEQAYLTWQDPSVGVPSLWEPAEPTGSGS
jgi:Flp pilus assembly pilin Flp